MRPALARHDILTREAVEQNRGRIVKTTGDGFHAVFDDPVDALAATLQLQLSLTDPEATAGVPLRLRCGLHVGVDERRDNDFFGPVVNRAARIMNAAHGGQILVSQAVVALIADRLPTDVALRDLGRVRLRDLTNSELVYQVLHPRLRQEFPALRSLESTPNNLPQQVTTFVGRKREQSEIKAALRRARLLTLSGIGGLGKTRLSLQIAADVVSDYPEGVWFVEFAPIADERLVPQAVATVLGVREEIGQPVIEALTKHVRDRKVLLVLDNCEHLVRACAELAKQLLQAGAGVKILASSREHFNVTGETVYTVPPLSVPGADGRIVAETIVQYEAVHLFIERAMAVQPAFNLTEQNASAVVEICQRLDGIPLALELAAARVRSLSVQQIAERVNDRFRLLTTGDRTALPRQQTLRALIDWSFDLLTVRERVLFRRVAVFAGGWTLEAAEVVGSGGEVDQTEVLDLLGDLVDKSLVMMEAAGGRYGLLETVRQYAQERLAASNEEAQIRLRHLHYYLGLAELARPYLIGSDQAIWLARLDQERENLLAAHVRCGQVDDGIESGFRLVFALRQYWFNRGMLALGHRATLEALERSDAGARTFLHGRALSHAGQFALFMGRYAEARASLEQSQQIARELQDEKRVAALLQPLGMACYGLGDFATARNHLHEGLALARKLGDARELAAATIALAQLERMEGHLDAAEPLYETALTLAQQLGDRQTVAVSLVNLAIVAIGRRREDSARKLLLDVLTIVKETGSKPAGQSTIEVSAGLGAALHCWDVAAKFYGAAETQAAQTGLHRDAADEVFLAPLIAETRARLGAADFAKFEAAGRALPYERVIAEVESWLR
jgi:predicted ATPase